MRVLFLTQYFAPEVGATQARTYDMARALVGAGHRVTVICEMPNHPAGRILPAYRGRLLVREQLDGIDVIRVWVKTSPTKTYGSRLSFYATYMVMAAFAGCFLSGEHHNLVFATSPPLLVGGAGLAIARRHRLPFVFEVRDPWPAAAVALGELRDGPALRLAQWLERQCYAHAAKVITVSDGWRRYLLEQRIPPSRIELIANGANTELFRPQPAAGATLRQKLGLDARTFVVVYAGLHGIAQGLETVLRAAALLQGAGDVRFALAGDGPAKPDLMNLAKRLGLSNTLFLNAVPRHEAAALFSMADMALVPLRRRVLLRGAVPTKAFDAWACGTPLLASADGELSDLVEAAEGGICVAPEEPEALAAAIIDAAQSRERCRSMGENGRRFVHTHYQRAEQARTFVQILEQVADDRDAPGC